MKDVFAERAIASFWDIMRDFLESLAATFPDCAETSDWKLWINNVIANDEKKRVEGIEKWCAGAQSPLKKGCAKYAKAVASITGAPACVYQAGAYRDIDAIHASDKWLCDLNLPEKLRSAAMNDKSRVIFWKYMDELNKHAYAATGIAVPRVPTSEEIAADIQRRKGLGSSLPTGKAPGLQQGLHELWKQLCESRGVAPENVDEVGQKLTELSGVCMRCRDRDADAFAEAAAALGLGADPPTEEHWTLLDKAFGMATMESAIPAPMMRGIESVANKLVKDLASGNADLGALDIESIGKQVLCNVSNDDVSSFADNLDKILPALERMHPMAGHKNGGPSQ